ncbi:hypothetical protein Tco_0070395 [Tanacetum coccineum]
MVNEQLFEKLNIEYVQFGEDGGGGGMMVVGGCESGEGDRVSNWTSNEDEEVSLVDGVLECALGALGDGVFVSSWVKSTNNCFGGMMLIFDLLEALEMEALVDVMDVDNG